MLIMATATLARILLAICLSFLIAQRVTAQRVGPTNSTSNSSVTAPFVLITELQGMKTSPNINPLTDSAGLNGSPSQLEVTMHLHADTVFFADTAKANQPTRTPHANYHENRRESREWRHSLHQLRTKRLYRQHRRYTDDKSSREQQTPSYRPL